MTLTIDEILERVAWTEGERAGYNGRAARWESMWKLKVFKQSAEEAWAEGKEQVTLPEPYDVVNLALRLLSNTPSIDVPAEDVDADKDESAERRQQFLAGLWHRSNREQRVNLVKNAAWMGLVRGRFAFDVRWIGDQLPRRLQGRRLPLLDSGKISSTSTAIQLEKLSRKNEAKAEVLIDQIEQLPEGEKVSKKVVDNALSEAFGGRKKKDCANADLMLAGGVAQQSPASATNVPPWEDMPDAALTSPNRRRLSQDKVKLVAEMLGLSDGDEEEVLIRLIDEFLALKNS